ncbi:MULTISPECIES: siderophore-interacting protein [unclassified Arthrobacter]|uniref:siderophore-interacting protein n=1 Tax=unclassified Arthrobacter TaxID=235627 RepID=UPI001E4CAAF7|nr:MULTISPECIES: siderophore-interacting protein [unclassified Arthrobacter]MCC9145826.1 siderophore-interacting protein [Arthrobacter sp. zg-Y919]MDK1277055.1 siderophore-interacting protein [Arthrobacter sp. zg.Y919]WIB03582.1 siderophore-interacting protein [Arthrobacter sp. zg-Y919]
MPESPTPPRPAGPTQDIPRRQRPLVTLEVLRREQISGHMVRVVAGGPGFDRFQPNSCADAYCKIWFGPQGRPIDGSEDLETLRSRSEREHWPVSRTYTIRNVDHQAREVSIDFVVHGDEGLAGPWAASAQAGEPLTFSGPGGAFNPDPDADWYLLAADESALPAVATVLRALPQDAVGHAFVEVAGPQDQQPVEKPAGVELTWLHRGDTPAGRSRLLTDAVSTVRWRDGAVQVFAHGEREVMKSLRDVLFSHRGLERRQVSLSGYWAAGRSEDVFQAEKRTPVGKIL